MSGAYASWRTCNERLFSTATATAPRWPLAPSHEIGDAKDLSIAEARAAWCALIDVTNNVPQIVPGLLAWIGHACDWELNRRACVDFPLQSFDAVIPPEEDAASIAAVMTLRARFAQGNAGAVVALFDAMIRALTGGERRH